MLGAGCWSSSLQCAVERHAIGHRCRCRCMLSLSLSHRVLSLSHRAHHRRCAVPSRHAPRHRRTLSSSSSSPCVVIVIAMRRHRHRHASSSSSLHRCLAVPRAVVHRRCTVVPLLRCWICRCRLPPSSLLCHLRRRTVRCRHHGAIGCRRRTVFALLGPPPSPLGIAMPCTRLAAPLCHPTASVCVVAPLCAAIVVVHGARALCGWHLFSGAVPGPWACRWGGGEGAAGAPCVLSQCAVVTVISSSWPDPMKPAPHSSARCWGCSWPMVVVWCVLGIPDGSRGGGSTASWPLVGRSTRVVGAMPGPLGPVDGGMGGCHWCRLIVFTTAALCGCGR